MLNRREIKNILLYDFAQFLMLRQAAFADNCEDALDVRIEQTLAQDALPNHARRSEENHFHLTVSDLSQRRVPKRSGGTLHFFRRVRDLKRREPQSAESCSPRFVSTDPR